MASSEQERSLCPTPHTAIKTEGSSRNWDVQRAQESTWNLESGTEC